ncbi:GNAT family N-acetyltransferase [Chitinophagaceae bacterium MMS25-I14]
MENISIRKVTLNDIDHLLQISRQTFFETFAAVNTEENMQQYLDNELTGEKLTAELNNDSSGFYFAERGGHVIGYLKLNSGTAQTELKDNKGLEIERIYVLKEYHGKAVGQLLYEYALQVARQNGAGYVWLGVWEENHRAIRFYEKNGFVAFDKHLFRLGDDEQTDIMMKLQLREG